QAGPHRSSDAADLGKIRRGDAPGGKALSRTRSRLRMGALRKFQPHAACRGKAALPGDRFWFPVAARLIKLLHAENTVSCRGGDAWDSLGPIRERVERTDERPSASRKRHSP